MKIDRLFQVVVVAGVSATTTLLGCSDDGGSDDGSSKSSGGTGTGTGGVATGGTSSGGGVATGGTTATGGAAATGGVANTGGDGTGGSGDACEAVCEPNESDPANLGWIDCNGCCCWLDPGESGLGVAACPGTEACCVGRGR